MCHTNVREILTCYLKPFNSVSWKTKEPCRLSSPSPYHQSCSSCSPFTCNMALPQNIRLYPTSGLLWALFSLNKAENAHISYLGSNGTSSKKPSLKPPVGSPSQALWSHTFITLAMSQYGRTIFGHSHKIMTQESRNQALYVSQSTLVPTNYLALINNWQENQNSSNID